MSGNTSKGTFQPDSDVHITFEDQQKINKFAQYNAQMEDCKEELKSKLNELKNLEDAAEELELTLDEGGKIPFLIGEVFIYQSLEDTQSSLADAKSQLQKSIQEVEEKCSSLKSTMATLKTQLYAKFGNHINLEADEE
ncbi:prefoldin subunit 4 [Lycorma delicatula]|uniref:prefoldin subunit 4 n=1 Tax=Lycorma delicatula TaxID=130591 RepID=UPI003F51353D